MINVIRLAYGNLNLYITKNLIMRTTRTNATEEVLDYIETLPNFSKQICSRLRKIILNAVPDIIEDWKLGPNYMWLGIVCSFTCFQKHVKLTFLNGSVMSDSHHLFKSYLEKQLGRAHQFSRSIRYVSANELNEKVLTKYIQESAGINECGFKNKIISNQVSIPGKLKRILLMSKNPPTPESGFSYNMPGKHLS